jgi:Glycosyltransferase family 87
VRPSFRRPGRTALATWLVVLGVYGLALAFERYGILSSTHGGDVSVYAADARAIAHGRLPYRDLYFEYPPGALVPILAPEPATDYATAFKALMAVCGGAALLAGAAVLRTQGRALLPLLAVAVSPLAVGSVFVNRFDVWPALLTVAALALLARGRSPASFALLAVGAATKVFPVVVLPAAAVWVWRREGRHGLRRALVAFVATGLVVLVPFAALGPGGLRFSFTVQLTRHLQTESLGGAILLAANRLGLYNATIATGKPGSLDLFGTLPDVVASLSLVAVAALVAWGAWTLGRGPVAVERLVAAVATAVTVYVAVGKVLSPQYLVWLVPLVPLVRRRPGVAATALLLAALVLTQLEFDHHYHELAAAGPVVWILLARDLVLAVLAGLLLRVSAYEPGGSHTAKTPVLTSR